MAKLIIKNRYGVVPNHILNNAKLSLKAKGLFAYLQSKPDEWSFSMERMALQTTDKIDGIRTGIHELEKAGLLKRTPVKNADGTWGGYDYLLLDLPSLDLPTTVLPTLEKPHTLSKKDSSKQDIVIKNSTFDEFWEKYPKKVGKVDALKAWSKLSLTDTLRSTILAGLEVWKKSPQWTKDDGRFIPNPATFINGRRWEDEVVVKKPTLSKYDSVKSIKV